MLPIILIIGLSIFVAYSVKIMINRCHDLHALAFLTLYIYTIFAQIGYAFFPEVSMFYGAYFGPNLFYKYWSFMFFSFVFSFFLYNKLNSKNSKGPLYIVKSAGRNFGEYIFYIIVILLYLSLNLYFSRNSGLFGYGGGKTMGGPWFGVGFLFFQTCTFILYTLFRDNSKKIKKRVLAFIVFVLCFLFFLQVNVKSGSRSYILFFFIGIIFYELSPIFYAIKYQKIKIFIFLVISFLVFNSLSALRGVRNLGEETSFYQIFNYDRSNSIKSDDPKSSDDDIASIILAQDYFLPSHTLFLSMHYKIIDPVEVVISNFTNSLVYFNYPFLTNTILVRGLGIENDRGVGWAYHYFVEGYNALGLLGVFYNAIFWNFFMALWIRLSRSSNKRYNKAIFAIIAMMIGSTMKSQNSAFVHNYWLILIPAIVLLLLANNQIIAFIRKSRLHEFSE